MTFVRWSVFVLLMLFVMLPFTLATLPFSWLAFGLHYLSSWLYRRSQKRGHDPAGTVPDRFLQSIAYAIDNFIGNCMLFFCEGEIAIWLSHTGNPKRGQDEERI